MTETLSSKVVKGSSWLFLFQVLDNVLAFIRLLILARLLTPADFGLVGVATLVVQILNTFTQTGVSAVLIQHKDSAKYMNVGWTYLFIRGFVLYALLFVVAPYLGIFFKTAAAGDIIRVIGLSVLFDGMANVGVIYFQKNLTFNKQFVYQITGNIADCVVAVTLAVIYKNVWAIVAGYVINSFIRLILSYILSNYKPKFDFNFKLIKEMNAFGKWIMGSTILTFLFTQGDDLLVGKVLGTTSLGFYQLAYRISNLPATQISFIISTVMFPAYALLQSEKAKLSEAYLSTLQVTAFMSFFMGSMIIAFAYEFTHLFIGVQWLPMVYVMQVLTVWGVMRSIGATTGALWQAVGTPHKVTRIQFIQTIIMAVIIYPLMMKWGYTGAGVAVVLAAIVGNSIAIYQISKSIQAKLSRVLIELFYPLVSSVLVFIVFYTARHYLLPNTNILSFILLAILCVCSYFGGCIILSKYFKYTVFKDIFVLVENFPGVSKYKISIQQLKRLFL